MSDDANKSDQNDHLQDPMSSLPPKEPEESHPEETETPQDAYREAWRPKIFSGRDKPEHEKKELDYNGTPVQIDTQLVQLIQCLWANQWGTLNSCYNSSNKLHLAYIHFATQEHALHFFNAIADHVSLAVWDRRVGQGAAIRFPTDEIDTVTDHFCAAGN